MPKYRCDGDITHGWSNRSKLVYRKQLLRYKHHEAVAPLSLRYRYGTLHGWRIHLDPHIIPALGSLRIQQCSVENVEKAAAGWAEVSSAKTANKILTTLVAVVKLAQRYGPLRGKENAAKLAERLKIANEDNDLDEVLPDQVYSEAELKELIGATEPGSLERVLVMVPVLTGLRIGEVLGLTWDAVDLKAGVISVRRSLVVDHELGFVLKAPKSASSQRTLDMPRELGHELKLWRFKCPPNEQDLILPSRLGKFIQRKVAGNIFDAIIDRAGIRRLTFHKLRHTFASLLLSKGRDIAEVSRLLGHTTAQSHCGSTPISSPETRPRCRIWPQAS